MMEMQVDIIFVAALIPGRGQQDCPYVRVGGRGQR